MNVAVDGAITECYATAETNCILDIEKNHAYNIRYLRRRQVQK